MCAHVCLYVPCVSVACVCMCVSTCVCVCMCVYEHMCWRQSSIAITHHPLQAVLNEICPSTQQLFNKCSWVRLGERPTSPTSP